MNATEAELEASSESCERWGWRCGGLVVVAIAAEVLIAAFNLPYGSFFERWGNVLAGALIALGVAGEIMFARMGHSRQSELSRRSNDKLADANRKLASLAPRSLSKEQFDEIQTLRGKIAELNLVVEADVECTTFSVQLAVAFSHAGIKVLSFPLRPDFRGQGLMLYDRYAFDNPHGEPTDGEPLIGTFKRANLWIATTIGGLPVDVNIPVEIPALFVMGKAGLPFATTPFFGPQPTTAK